MLYNLSSSSLIIYLNELIIIKSQKGEILIEFPQSSNSEKKLYFICLR